MTFANIVALLANMPVAQTYLPPLPIPRRDASVSEKTQSVNWIQAYRYQPQWSGSTSR